MGRREESAPYALDPFGPSANPAAYVPNEASERVRHAMEAALEANRSAAVIGPPGHGKTLLLHLIGDGQKGRSRVAYVAISSLDVEGFFALALEALGRPASETPRESFGALVAELGPRGGVTLLVDDAHSMQRDTAEALAGIHRAAHGDLRVVFAALDGDATFRVLQLFGQNLEVVSLHGVLSESEARRYLESRLAYAGARPELVGAFDDERVAQLHRLSEGVPRRLNQAAQDVVREAAPGPMPQLSDLADAPDPEPEPERELSLAVLAERVLGGEDAYAHLPEPAHLPDEAESGERAGVEASAAEAAPVEAAPSAEPMPSVEPEASAPVVDAEPEPAPPAPDVEPEPEPPAVAVEPEPPARALDAEPELPAPEEPEPPPPAEPEPPPAEEWQPAPPPAEPALPPVRAEVSPEAAWQPPRPSGARPAHPSEPESVPAARAPETPGDPYHTILEPDPPPADPAPEHRPPQPLPPRPPQRASYARRREAAPPEGAYRMARDPDAAARRAQAAAEFAEPERVAPVDPTPAPGFEGLEPGSELWSRQTLVTVTRWMGFGAGVGVAVMWLAGRGADETPPAPERSAVETPAAAERPAAPVPDRPDPLAGLERREPDLLRPPPTATRTDPFRRPGLGGDIPAPAEAAAPPAGTVPVSINATPWATIEVDGLPLGETPLARVPLAPGPHLFRATFPDGEVREQSVEISADNRAVSFR